jgi:GT2 family glycosyltransferase
MYGEDVDFYLRIQTLGKIHCSVELPVLHLNDPANRESYRDICLYHDGVRWLLAARYPQQVSRSKVLLAAVILAGGELAKFLASGNKKHLRGAQGHVEFLVRLATGRQVLQTISNQSDDSPDGGHKC